MPNIDKIFSSLYNIEMPQTENDLAIGSDIDPSILNPPKPQESYESWADEDPSLSKPGAEYESYKMATENPLMMVNSGTTAPVGNLSRESYEKFKEIGHKTPIRPFVSALEASESLIGGAKDIYEGDYLRGGAKMVGGGLSGFFLANPMVFASEVAAPVVEKAAREGVKALGGGEKAQEIGERVGSFANSVAFFKFIPAVLLEGAGQATSLIAQSDTFKEWFPDEKDREIALGIISPALSILALHGGSKIIGKKSKAKGIPEKKTHAKESRELEGLTDDEKAILEIQKEIEEGKIDKSELTEEELNDINEQARKIKEGKNLRPDEEPNEQGRSEKEEQPKEEEKPETEDEKILKTISDKAGNDNKWKAKKEVYETYLRDKNGEDLGLSESEKADITKTVEQIKRELDLPKQKKEEVKPKPAIEPMEKSELENARSTYKLKGIEVSKKIFNERGEELKAKLKENPDDEQIKSDLLEWEHEKEAPQMDFEEYKARRTAREDAINKTAQAKGEKELREAVEEAVTHDLVINGLSEAEAKKEARKRADELIRQKAEEHHKEITLKRKKSAYEKRAKKLFAEIDKIEDPQEREKKIAEYYTYKILTENPSLSMSEASNRAIEKLSKEKAGEKSHKAAKESTKKGAMDDIEDPYLSELKRRVDDSESDEKYYENVREYAKAKYKSVHPESSEEMASDAAELAVYKAKVRKGKIKFRESIGMSEYDTDTGESLPKRVSEKHRPFPFMGNKVELLRKKAYRNIFSAGLRGANRVIDAFMGTGANSNAIRDFGVSPKVIKNEYNKLRAGFYKGLLGDKKFLDKVDEHADRIASITNVGSGENERKVAIAKLREYLKEHDREPSLYAFVQSIQRLSTPLKESYLEVLNKESKYKTDKSGNKILGENGEPIVEKEETLWSSSSLNDVHRKALDFRKGEWRYNRLEAVKESARGHEIRQGDAWDEIKKSQKGDFVIVDPTYIAKDTIQKGELRKKGTAEYDKDVADDADFETFMWKVDKYIVPKMKEGVKFIITNTWTDEIASALRDRGFNVLKTSRGQDKPEIVAYNYDTRLSESDIKKFEKIIKDTPGKTPEDLIYDNNIPISDRPTFHTLYNKNRSKTSLPKGKEALKASQSEPDNQLADKNIAKGKADVVYVEPGSVKVDEKRFQNRVKLNQKILNEIENDFNESLMDPIIIWKDPKDGQYYLLAGHHRLRAVKDLELDRIKAQVVDFPTEKEAIEWATEKSNANRSMETPIERAKIYSKMRAEGKTRGEIKDKADALEGKNASYILNLSHLSPKGLTAMSLSQMEESGSVESRQTMEKIADKIGNARKLYPELTDEHENELYRYLNDKPDLINGSKQDFLDMVDNIVNSIVFSASKPLNLKSLESPEMREYNQEIKQAQTDVSRAQAVRTQKLKEFVKRGLQGERLDKALKKYDDEVTYTTQQLIKLKEKYGDVKKAVEDQFNLFGGEDNGEIRELDKPRSEELAELQQTVTRKAEDTEREEKTAREEDEIETVEKSTDEQLKVIDNKLEELELPKPEDDEQTTLFQRKQSEPTREEKLRKDAEKVNKLLGEDYTVEFTEDLKDPNGERVNAQIDLKNNVVKIDKTRANDSAVIHEIAHGATKLVLMKNPKRGRALLRLNGWDGEGDPMDFTNKTVVDAWENIAEKSEIYRQSPKWFEENEPRAKWYIELFGKLKHIWEAMRNFAKGKGWVSEAKFYDDMLKGKFNSGKTAGFTPFAYLQQKMKDAFYSKVERLVEQKAPNRNIDARQLIAMLKKNGAKKDELAWLDIEGFLDRNPKATKQDLLNYIKENNVKIEVVEIGGNPHVLDRGRIHEYNNKIMSLRDGESVEIEGYVVRYNRGVLNVEHGGEDIGEPCCKEGVVDFIEGDLDSLVPDGEPKYSAYQLPGGENYREILVTMPSSDYESGHWDEKGVVLHYRVNDRTVDGKKTLFVEELQSDWQREQRGGKDVPDYPFKSTWAELGIKHILRKAAEEGYDQIAFITGKDTADRYDLSKYISSLAYVKKNNELRVWDKYSNEQKVIKVSEGNLEKYVGKDIAKQIADSKDDVVGVTGSDLKIGGEWAHNLYDRQIPNILDKMGKKFGAKTSTTSSGIINRTGEIEVPPDKLPNWEFSDETLSVENADPTWVIDFDANEIREKANDGDELQPTVGRVTDLTDSELASLFGGVPAFHVFEIPEKMKESVLQGQPLFQKADKPIQELKTLPEIKERLEKDLLNAENKKTPKTIARYRMIAYKRAIINHIKAKMTPTMLKKGEVKKLLSQINKANSHITLIRAVSDADRIIDKAQARQNTAKVYDIIRKTAPKSAKNRVMKSRNTEADFFVLANEILKDIPKQRKNEEKYNSVTIENMDEEKQAVYFMLHDLKNRTAAQTQEILDRVKEIQTTGRVGFKKIIEERRAEKDKRVNMLLEDMGVKDGKIPESRDIAKKWGIARRHIGYLQLHSLSSMIDYLKGEGFMGGKFGQWYGTELQKTHDKELILDKNLTGKIEKSYENIFGKHYKAVLSKESARERTGIFVKVNDQKIEIVASKNELAKKWLEWQDPKGRKDLEQKMGYTDETINKIEDYIGGKWVKLALWSREFEQERFAEYDKAHRDIFLAPAPAIKNHTRLYSADIYNEEASFWASNKPAMGLTPGSAHLRIDKPTELSYVSLTKDITMQAKEHSRFVTTSKFYRNVFGAITDQRVKKSLIGIFGERQGRKIHNVMLEALRSDGRGRIQNKDDSVERILDGIISNLYRAFLFSPKMTIKQLTSHALYAWGVNPKELAKYDAQWAGHPIKNSKWVYNNMPAIRERWEKGFEEFIAEFSNKEQVPNIVKKMYKMAPDQALHYFLKHKSEIKNAPLIFTKLGDIVPIFPGAYSTYKYYNAKFTEQGYENPHELAILYAELLTGRTQQTPMFDLRAVGAREKGKARLFYAYTQTPVLYWQAMMTTAKTKTAKEHPHLLVAAFGSVLAAQILYVIASTPGDTKHPKKLAVDVGKTYFNLPLINYAAEAAWYMSKTQRYKPNLILSQPIEDARHNPVHLGEFLGVPTKRIGKWWEMNKDLSLNKFKKDPHRTTMQFLSYSDYSLK